MSTFWVFTVCHLLGLHISPSHLTHSGQRHITNITRLLFLCRPKAARIPICPNTAAGTTTDKSQKLAPHPGLNNVWKESGSHPRGTVLLHYTSKFWCRKLFNKTLWSVRSTASSCPEQNHLLHFNLHIIDLNNTKIVMTEIKPLQEVSSCYIISITFWHLGHILISCIYKSEAFRVYAATFDLWSDLCY